MLRSTQPVARSMFGGALVLLFSFFLTVALPVDAAAPGGSCTANADCSEAECADATIGCFCAGLIAGPTGTCRQKASIGEPCVEDAHCRGTARCNIRTLVCEAGPAPAAPAAPTAPAPASTKEAGSEAAPPTRTPGEFGYTNPLGTVNINQLLGRIIRTVLGIVGALFLVMFIYGGAQWMLAGGEEARVKSSRQTLLNAVAGMIIIALSYSMISILFETAGLIRGDVVKKEGKKKAE